MRCSSKGRASASLQYPAATEADWPPLLLSSRLKRRRLLTDAVPRLRGRREGEEVPVPVRHVDLGHAIGAQAPEGKAEDAARGRAQIRCQDVFLAQHVH